MSISSDGIFFYGMIWKSEEPPWKELSAKELEEDDDLSTNPEWEDIYCLRSGKEIRGLPVEIGVHCSFESSWYFLGIKSTIVRASRGYPEKAPVTIESSEWRSQLEEFCAIMGIEWQEPAWWVTSIYG